MDREHGQVTGVFAEETPMPGRTWHILRDGQPVCGHQLAPGRYEVWTTSTMPVWKVCDDCLTARCREFDLLVG